MKSRRELNLFYHLLPNIESSHLLKISLDEKKKVIFACSGLLAGSDPVDILSTGLMTLDPDDEVEEDARLGMELICTREQ